MCAAVNKVCKICGADHYAKGLCAKHYTRLKRHGDPNYCERNLFFRGTSFEERYEIDKITGCWNWLAKKTSKGYGVCSFIINGSIIDKAHRYSWIKTFGPIPKGLYVCHKCDNPSCVNPDHLFLGTQDDNMKDMKLKGRANRPKGLRNSHVKLGILEVYYIRQSYNNIKILAQLFNVTKTTIRNIKIRKIWGWLE